MNKLFLYKLKNKYIIPIQINTNKLVIHKNIINFSKLNVPFIFNILIKQIHDNYNNLIYLIGISYNNHDTIPIHITPVSYNYNALEKELDNLPYAIVLTSITIPYHILYVNNKWLETTGYDKINVLGRTFNMLQGKEAKYKNDADIFREKLRILNI